MQTEGSKEYNDFMEWFEKNYPADYEKYHRNISVPFQEGGGVSVTNSFKISKEEYDYLFSVVQLYYKQG